MRALANLVCVLICSTALSHTAGAAPQLPNWTGRAFPPVFGREVDCDGDVDGDGAQDVLVSCCIEGAGGAIAAVLVYSGQTFELLRRWRVHAEGGDMPVVAYVGDIDGDGRTDVGVAGVSPKLTELIVVCGVSGATLLRVAPVSELWHDVPAFDAAPDRDGDGLGDLALASFVNFAPVAHVVTVSGKTGARLGEHVVTRIDRTQSLSFRTGGRGRASEMLCVSSPWTLEQPRGLCFAWAAGGAQGFALTLERITAPTVYEEDEDVRLPRVKRAIEVAPLELADLDRDGIDDLLVRHSDLVENTREYSRLVWYAGSDGRELYRFDACERASLVCGAALGDVDADGRLDFAIGASARRDASDAWEAGCVSTPGAIFVVSGRTRAPLWVLRDSTFDSTRLATLCALARTKGGAVSDLVCGLVADGTTRGRLLVYAGTSGVLVGELAEPAAIRSEFAPIGD